MLKKKDLKNWYTDNILVGIVIIILSETSLRFIENDFFKNIKIIFIPFIFFLTFYFYLLIKFSTHQRLTFNKK